MPAPWTPPERRALRDLWRKGVAPSVIATSLRAQFGHRYRAADIPGRVRDFGFLAEHPEAPAVEPPVAASVAPSDAPGRQPRAPSWPEPAIDRLTQMWRDGATGPSIAGVLTLEFGTPRSRSAVMGMINRLGLNGQQGQPAEEPAEAPVEKRAIQQDPTPQPESQQPVVEPTQISPATNEAAKINTPPEPQVPAQPEPLPEPIRQPAPIRASTTKTTPEYAGDHAPPARAPLAVVRPEPRPADWPPAAGTPLADLRWGECHFPVSGFRAERHLFCAAPATGDSPYCAEHRAAALQVREPGRRPGRYPGWVADGGAR